MRVRPIVFVLGALLLPAGALAQTPSNRGFALDRFDPAERGSDWFGIESLSFSGSRSPVLGATVDYAHQPLVLRRGDDEIVDIVSDQFFLHLGASAALFQSLQLGINLPIAIIDDGNPAVVNGVRYSLNKGTTLGDLRLGGRYRLFGRADGAVRAGVGLTLHLPTGSRSALTGDNGVRVTPNLHVAGDVGALAYAAGLGWKIHSRHGNYAGQPFGSDIEFRAALGVWAWEKKLLLGPEFYSSTTVSDGGKGFFHRRTTPAELMLGAHLALSRQLRAGVGAGPGLGWGFGSPELRVLANLEWSPGGEPGAARDTDQDGIEDARDACPDRPGRAHPDPSLNGCPVADRDRDGVPDATDACPDHAGKLSADARLNGCPDRDDDGIVDAEDACPDKPGQPHDDRRLNGCPAADRDGDGIDDRVDACQDQPGPAASDPAQNGCPAAEPDDDGDGVPNSADACPNQPGVQSADPAQHGCPLARIESGQIKILEQVQFATGSAEILPVSDATLEAVKKILVEHPEITRVSIDGHTDNQGGRELNRGLSRQRAVAVQNWLVRHGIQGERLVAKGFGQDRPLADNDTEAGRQKNRRVEFHILDARGDTPRR